MARTSDPNSATSEFFFNTQTNSFLDSSGPGTGYAAFGTIVSGLDVPDAIFAAPTTVKGPFSNVPQVNSADVTIRRAAVVARVVADVRHTPSDQQEFGAVGVLVVQCDAMRLLTSCAAAWLLISGTVASANHGPGTSGGGTSTASGETLKQGKFDFSLRWDYSNFENISRAQAESRAARSGGFDALQESYVTTFSIAYGVTNDFQISAQIGYYCGHNFIDAESEGGEVGSGIADPSGLTDLWLNAKFRILKGQPGNVSVIAGVKLPTGKDNVRLDNGEVLEASSQPGTGAWDFQIGLAYSRFLTSRITIDGSAMYTFRTEHDDFRVGDRFDAGVALAYRITENINKFPNYSVFVEATTVWIGKDEVGGDANPNSGGTTIYLSPGFRVRFTENVALAIAPSFPIYQNLSGDQIEVDFKLAAVLSFSF